MSQKHIDLIRDLKRENKILKIENAKLKQQLNPKNITVNNINKDLNERLELYMNLFKGRNDVYALKHFNKKGQKVYYPVIKEKYKKWNDETKRYDIIRTEGKSIYHKIDSNVYMKHLSKFEHDFSIGIYPLLNNDTCFFTAIDLDGDHWKEDTLAIIDILKKYDISHLIEKSQSGKGAHVWFFFEQQTPAIKARRFATIILSLAMRNSKSLNFSSYDRIFPTQDYLPKDGIGNLIALPLEGMTRKNNTGIFLDNYLNDLSYDMQWEVLSLVNKITSEKLYDFLENHDQNIEYQYLAGEESNQFSNSTQKELGPIQIIRESRVKIQLDNLSSETLNYVRSISSFKNPEFFKNQRMRFSNWNVPRIICCAEIDDNYVYIPKNVFFKLEKHLLDNDIDYHIIDKRSSGEKIQSCFNGQLKPRQQAALDTIMKHDMGVISAPTGFGKTVLGAKTIDQFKTNTLIIVPNKLLLYQWKNELERFLDTNYDIGLLGDNNNSLTGNIDIAIINSLDNHIDSIEQYGLILVDECHRAASLRYELTLQKLNPKRIYGFTATPIRNNGQELLIFMQCGDIIFETTQREDYLDKSFETTIYPVLSPFQSRSPNNKIQDIYDDLHNSNKRNKIISDLIVKNEFNKRSVLVLSNRIAHLDNIASLLNDAECEYLLITGETPNKQKKEILEKLKQLRDSNEKIILLSTGQFIGEGFDLPSLDTLILTSPIAWEGSLTQFIGRVNRDYKDKETVHIYDIVDYNIPVLSKMYKKRLRTYKKHGYTISEHTETHYEQVIYQDESFLNTLKTDIDSATTSVTFSVEFLSINKIKTIETLCESLFDKGVELDIISQKRNKKHSKKIYEYMYTSFINLYLSKSEISEYILVDQNIIWYGDFNLNLKKDKNISLIRMINSEYYWDFINLNQDVYLVEKNLSFNY